ncbi:NAD(P)H-quinone oxidoreductase subunit I, chloroplastic [Methanobrevibacter cuticularis]|uniref:CoB--CoM heterodisulfide reductase iron-sulfur subunit A n=1 Tax=Methanobrevibacter cuticularis TaxID=47311 RepID=A0A166F2T4_9EURY|nr:ferredoxin:CoB-CoM heterodisulfide reductase subunit HdrA [Methanobrevibacter cuticularis]KZX17259.1 NAD(P)H-quinone oxidoreductase subunit I, chloroplastic [Methanobrevibacter cuticularis]
MNTSVKSPITPKNLRVGVFICECGGNISDIVDIEKVKSSINADVVGEFENLCSLNGRKIIRDNVINKNLDRVVIAACSPITHEKTFQDYVKPLNPYLMDMANLREHCSWVHDDKKKATEKAITLINASIEKVKQAQAVDPILCQTTESAAVIGGGISGISTAISLAKQGVKTYLIEQNPSIGGKMVKIGKVFSPVKLAEECGMCLLNPVINEAIWNENIEIMTNTKAISAERRAGNFNILLESKPRYVDEKKCISCGKCIEVCPVEVPDSWNDGLSMRKAIYKPFSQSYPDAYTIDIENCEKCGKCKKVCTMDAIYLKGENEMIPLNVGSLIIATGHKTFDPNLRPEYGYDRYEDVITQSELGRIMGVNGPTKGKLKMLSNGKVPRRIVMIQCVGSRDEKPDGHRYCSQVCCMVALKNANIIKHKYPDTDIIICYTDIRTPGMYEKYYKHGQESGIRLIRGRPGEVSKKGDSLVVRVEDTIQKEFTEIETDMVVLSTAIEPSEGTKEIAEIMNIGLTEDMFIKETHPKIKPVTTDVKGAFVCGTAQGPKDITNSIIQANAASSKVAEIMNNGLEIEPFIAEIDPEICNLCEKCIDICKYKAMSIKDDKIYIDPLSCSGCGKCLTVCEPNAINIHGNIDEKIFATIDGMLKDKKEEETRILVFLDQVGYTAADNIGVNRVNYPESIYIIKIHSVNRVMLKHIIYALQRGADGIFIGEYPGDLMYHEVEKKMDQIRKEIEANGMNPERLEFSNVYIPYFKGLAEKFQKFDNKLKSLS